MEKLHHKIKYENYLFILNIKDSQTISISASDNQTFNIYEANDLVLKNIKSETIVVALENENQHVKCLINKSSSN